MVVVIVLSIFLKYPVLKSLNVKQPDTIESLSIPAQQIARVIKDEKELSFEQKKLLSKVIDIKKIPVYYVSYFSDPIKDLVREKGEPRIFKRTFKRISKLIYSTWFKVSSKIYRSLGRPNKGLLEFRLSILEMGRWCYR